MGKRILIQHRGKAGMQYRAPPKGRIAPAKYPFFREEITTSGRVMGLSHEQGRGVPLARVEYDNGLTGYLPAVEGLAVGSSITLGKNAEMSLGNILPLANIPEGSSICNIERLFGDGGKLVRTGGGSAILFTHTPSGSVIRLPSGKSITLNQNCRATIGKIAGGGRLEKPLLRAGENFRKHMAKNQMYPRVRGIAMISAYHPFGGGRHQHPGKSTSTSRNAPPGRKVGHIAPRKTGRKRIPRVQAGS